MDAFYFRRKRDYYRNDAPHWVRIVFDSFESFDWFCKNNRDALIATGALFRIGRDFFVHTQKFPNQVATLRGLPVDKPGMSGSTLMAESRTDQRGE